MWRPFAGGSLFLLACSLAVAQDSGPKFELAGVQPSAKTRSGMRNAAPRNGRYEIKNATVLDLIRIAYNMNNDRILGGPSWLEMDRFDVTAKLPDETTADDRRAMLKALLEERFKLVAHLDTKPVPTYILSQGKKLTLKESAEGEGESGCKPEGSPAQPGEGRISINFNGTPVALGPGMSVHMVCHNMTMEVFTAAIRTMIGSPNLGSMPVRNETGLKGAWNFDFRYSMSLIGLPGSNDGERVSFADGLEKTGLKLEKEPIPAQVVVVESVNRKPTPDSPEVAKVLPPIANPTEFEVANIKMTDPTFRGGRWGTQPGGRFTAQGMSLRNLVLRAFNALNREGIVGLPAFADSDRWDVTAKAPSADGQAPAMDNDAMAPMMRNLLADRFKLKYHTEDREVSAYTLTAPKPKLKKADPDARTSCKSEAGAAGLPPGALMVSCVNVTMDYFAENLQSYSFGALAWPVDNATELAGSWDISLVFNPNAGFAMGGGRGSGDTPGAAAADPSGLVTFFEAVAKTGLKLEPRKRTMPVIVIDHIEQKPTEN